MFWFPPAPGSWVLEENGQYVAHKQELFLWLEQLEGQHDTQANF